MSKTILMLAISLSIMTGCASAERQRRHEAAIARNEAIEAEKQNLQPGMPTAKIIELYGDPDQKNFSNGQYEYFYNNNSDPMRFTFQEDKLVGWVHDEALASQYRQQAASEAIARKQHRANIINAFGQGFNSGMGTNCTSTPNGYGGVNTHCN